MPHPLTLSVAIPPLSTLFPYTTLFRSGILGILEADVGQDEAPRIRGEFIELLGRAARRGERADRSEEHTSELQSPCNLVCRLLLEKKKLLKEPAFGWVCWRVDGVEKDE